MKKNFPLFIQYGVQQCIATIVFYYYYSFLLAFPFHNGFSLLFSCRRVLSAPSVIYVQHHYTAAEPNSAAARAAPHSFLLALFRTVEPQVPLLLLLLSSAGSHWEKNEHEAKRRGLYYIVYSS